MPLFLFSHRSTLGIIILNLPFSQRANGLILVALCIGFASFVSASDFIGKVVGVTDGDTITVLHIGTATKVRLAGIDCPEKAQPYGHKAKEATSALVFGKEVIVQAHGQDKYGRAIGDVLLPHGKNINHTLVREGWCWWYRKYAPGDTTLERLETDARAAKRGLWADPNPVPPWMWRHRSR